MRIIFLQVFQEQNITHLYLLVDIFLFMSIKSLVVNLQENIKFWSFLQWHFINTKLIFYSAMWRAQKSVIYTHIRDQKKKKVELSCNRWELRLKCNQLTQNLRKGRCLQGVLRHKHWPTKGGCNWTPAKRVHLGCLENWWRPNIIWTKCEVSGREENWDSTFSSVFFSMNQGQSQEGWRKF